jgi:NTE family protein
MTTHASQTDRARVGLVLGAGGVLGGAWLVGALDALAAEIGWDPGSAECIVGTSAGAMIGGLCASGVPPWFMLAHSSGEITTAVDGDEIDSGHPSRLGGAVYRLNRGVPALGPGSWRLAVASLARPYRYSPAAILAAWLPQGLISSEPLKEIIRRVADEQWPPHPNLWIVACEHDTGRRVVFGQADAPPASLADAVAASCAIPGFYHPVKIDGRRFIDGGIASTSNLDLVAGLGLDLVVCLNPTSSLHAPQPRTFGERAAAVLRQRSGRLLESEARRVRASGTDVLLIQPTVQDLDAIGTNLMSSGRRHQVIEVAAQTVRHRLREPEIRDRLRGLPRGAPVLVRRPRGRIAAVPDFEGLARGRWESLPGPRRAA